MDEAALLQFLLETSRRGYAAGQSAVRTREADHSTTIVIEQGDWRFHDNYFGGEPYGGREVVFLRGRPVWMAVYYGQVDGANVDAVYSFLQRTLREAPAEFPIRGPERFAEGRLSYQNDYQGGVASVSGEETIREDARLIYTGRYVGGMVDRRSGD